jgi:hypothetical protein
MKKIISWLCLLCTGGIISCTQEIPSLSLGIDDIYVIPRMKVVYFKPAFTGEAYQWSIKATDGSDSIVSTQKDYIFLPEYTRVYEIDFRIFDSRNPIEHHVSVYVQEEEVEYSPFISKVYEFRPAPGQFVNEMPKYEEGDTEKNMIQKAEEAIYGKNYSGVSLGAYGGYVTFGFDHTVVNRRGERDFLIEGNAFHSAAHPGVNGGSCEPGIVMVSFDENQNGIPDDKWYELDKDPWYTNEIAHLNYKITYNRPDPDREIIKDGALTDIYYIKWTDTMNQEGYVAKNQYHKQDYYPKWISEDQMEFEGTLLPKNAVDVSGDGSYYLQYMFEYGAYVDNFPNAAVDADGNNRSSFDIGWAVDPKTRVPVELPGVDFIRVYTAVNQYCGWLGETSTEIYQARDLHVYVRPSRPGE